MNSTAKGGGIDAVNNQQCGIYVVLFALMCIFILIFVGLVVATGFLTTGAARMQHVANLVSMSAIETFQQTQTTQPPPATPTPASYYFRANSALTRANDILAANPLPGFSFGDIYHGPGTLSSGLMTLGNWYPEDPSPLTCPGSGTPPCFIPNDYPTEGQEQRANAVKIEMRSPFQVPFCGFMGTCEKNLKSEAYATIVQRCTAFVIDLSSSTHFTTHKIYRDRVLTRNGLDPEDPAWYAVPECAGDTLTSADDVRLCAVYDDGGGGYAHANLALPFYRENRLQINRYSTPYWWDEVRNCDGPLLSQEHGIWCNMARDAANDFDSTRNPAAPVVITEHYMSDYLPRWYRHGATVVPLMVDSFHQDGVYEGPEPYASFFHAFNAALRSLQRQASAADRAMMSGFTGEIKARFPDTTPWLLSDFGRLVQISNIKNRGTIDINGVQTQEVRPNMIDYRFYPALGNLTGYEANTNPMLAINDAIDKLKESCPSPSARLTIVLASDGISSCMANHAPPYHSANRDQYICSATDLDYFDNAYQQLTVAGDGVLQRLIDNQIAVVAIVAGAHVGANFRNILYTDPDTGRSHYLSPAEAYARGMSSQVFSSENTCPSGPCSAAAVYPNLGKQGYVFRKPVQLMADLSINSGGEFCPLMPLCGSPGNLPPDGAPCSPCCEGEAGCTSPGCYIDHDSDPSTPCILDPARRPGDSLQTCSIVQKREAEQAAECVVKFLGESPYSLVIPEQ